jgi:hypothetical protein
VESDNNTIGGSSISERNVISSNTANGVLLRGTASNNEVKGNLIGTTADGFAALGNAAAGVKLEGSAAGATIGGTGSGDFNAISGNATGVHLTGSGTNINLVGNFIGADVNGLGGLPNTGVGVNVETSAAGSVVLLNNVISANGSHGVRLASPQTTLWGNVIGLKADFGATGSLPNTAHGVFVDNVADARVGGTAQMGGSGNLISGNGGDGVRIEGSNADGTLIYGNTIGTDAAGAVPLGNAGAGVRVLGGADNTSIGGGSSGQSNRISSNAVGVSLEGAMTGASVRQNIIGGTAGLGNAGHGIHVHSGASAVTIGGQSALQRNIISGNQGSGVFLNSSDNVVTGNWIGTSVTGVPSGNQGDGVRIEGANNQIGSTALGQGNVINHNSGDGVAVVGGGTSTGNQIRGNDIDGNGGLGIDLGPDGVNANQPQPVAGGGENNSQNYPEIGGVWLGSTNVDAILKAGLSQTYQIDYYTSPTCDAAGYGEGGSYWGTLTVTTGISGGGDSVGFVSPDIFPAGTNLTATATDANGNTSEFSACAGLADFAVAVSPTEKRVNTGGIDSVDVTVSARFGPFGGPVSLSCPSSDTKGIQCEVPGAGTNMSIGDSSLTVRIGLRDISAGELGGRTITVQGKAGSVTRTQDVQVTLQDFAVSLTPTTSTITQGDTATYTVALDRVPGVTEFDNPVTLSCRAPLPTDVACTFASNDVTPGFGATVELKVTTTGNTPVALSTITVDGVSRDLTRAGTARLDVTTAAVATFNVAAAPPTRSVAKGGSAAYTVAVQSVNGDFTSAVALACIGTLPPGTACQFSETSVTPGASGTTSELTVTTNAGTTTENSYTIEVEGTSGSDSSKTIVGLEVTTAPSYTMAATTTNGTVPRGGNATYTVNVTAAGGFSADVDLTCAGLPDGASCSFAPAKVAPGTPSTLTVATNATNTAAGSTDFTIIGASATLQNTASATIVTTDFGLAVDPATRSVAKGANATYTVSVAPVAAGGGFAEAVTFSCSGLPSGSVCSFANASLTPGSDTVSTTLTVTTDVSGLAAIMGEEPSEKSPKDDEIGAAPFAGTASGGNGVLFALLALTAVVVLSQRNRLPARLRPRLVSAVAIAVIATVYVGCDGAKTTAPSPPPPAGPQPVVTTFTIQGSGGGLDRTVDATISVTPSAN